MTAGRKINSDRNDWCTPPKYAHAIRSFFKGVPKLDPCSNKHSIIGAEIQFEIPYKDGLKQKWDYSTIYVNPPYGRDKIRGTTIKDWLLKCMHAHKQFGSEVLALVPVATNTSHWKEYVWGVATGICFLYDTRLKFLIDGTANNKGAPMACSMIYWGYDFKKFESIFNEYGAVIKTG